jgi:hypothetical protein
MLQSRKMSYDHNNPRLSATRTAAGQVEGYLTPYTGSKRSIQIQRSKSSSYKKKKKNRAAGDVPSETDALTSEQSEQPAVSFAAGTVYGVGAITHALYTTTLVVLVGMQNTVDMSIKVLLFLMLIHSCLIAGLLGMNHKIGGLSGKSVDTPHSGTALLQHVRDDRRKIVFFVSCVLSCAATIDVAYICRIATSWNAKADTFRSTGISTVVHREMDVLSMLVFLLLVPLVLWAMAEMSYGLQIMARVRKVQDTLGDTEGGGGAGSDSDEEGVNVVSSPS